MNGKINKIKTWQALTVIAIVGFAAYFDGLRNQFLGDDLPQIVNSVPVHSLANIRLFFEGGTFYIGSGLAPMYGVYFRPLMVTCYSLLYTMFGPVPLAFHLFQLVLCIGSSFFLYLIFRYSFKPALALFLAIVFLVHPLNSEVAFEISALQDVLYFFFGILSLYLLLRFKSRRCLLFVALCLFLSLLAKETGMLFVAVDLLYLIWYNKKRVLSFVLTMVIPIAVYVFLRVNAVGLLAAPHSAPIDNLSLSQRLMTAPSIPLFYVSKILFPWRLASGYYWVFSKYSVTHFLLPLIADLTLIVVIIYVARLIRSKASKATYRSYVFFAIWTALGFLLLLQVVPLDLTACDIWFYFPMAGILGMIGNVLSVFLPKLNHKQNIVLTVMVIIIFGLGIRTAARGPDWSSTINLMQNDLKASSEDFNADNYIATSLAQQGKLSSALTYAKRAVQIYPTSSSYNTLGDIYLNSHDYWRAETTYVAGLKLRVDPLVDDQLYQNAAGAMLLNKNMNGTQQFIKKALKKYPTDPTLWMYLAFSEYKDGKIALAKQSISVAYNYYPSTAVTSAYQTILNNRPVNLQ